MAEDLQLSGDRIVAGINARAIGWLGRRVTPPDFLSDSALAATLPRVGTVLSNAVTLTSGRLHLAAIHLEADDVVSTITFWSGTTAIATGSNQWFGLFDRARTKLAVTADDSNTAWAANSAKTLTLATPHRATYSGLHYVGICVVAATPPTLTGITNNTAGGTIGALAPAINGSADTGLTTPASCPAAAAALTANAGHPYATAA